MIKLIKRETEMMRNAVKSIVIHFVNIARCLYLYDENVRYGRHLELKLKNINK